VRECSGLCPLRARQSGELWRFTVAQGHTDRTADPAPRQANAMPPATSKHSPGVRILPGRTVKAKRVPEAALGPHRRSLP
jgi:hypothetical protein